MKGRPAVKGSKRKNVQYQAGRRKNIEERSTVTLTMLFTVDKVTNRRYSMRKKREKNPKLSWLRKGRVGERETSGL